jgi:hypothetical protein
MSLFPIISPAAAAVATVSFEAVVTDAAAATVYSGGVWNGVAIGAAAADRKVAIGIAHMANVGVVSSVTIGGVSATVVDSGTGGVDNERAEIWQADVPTGTTANIVVTMSQSQNRLAAGVFAIYGAASAAHDTATVAATGVRSTTIDIPASGVCIAVDSAQYTGSFKTHTWAGVTEDYDSQIEKYYMTSGGSDAFAAQQTGLTVSCTPSAAAFGANMTVASWGPA